jgi:hypothetical protein
MLPQNFLTSVDLALTNAQHAALVTVLGMLERGELVHVPTFESGRISAKPRRNGFNMSCWNLEQDLHRVECDVSCGSVCCIGGWAELVGDVMFYGGDWDYGNARHAALDRLFHPNCVAAWDTITPHQAAQALRSYLTTGDPHWDRVLLTTHLNSMTSTFVTPQTSGVTSRHNQSHGALFKHLCEQ